MGAGSNILVILPAVVGAIFVIITVFALYVAPERSRANKMRARLDGFARRFGGRSQSAEDAMRSIRANIEQPGLGSTLVEFLPRRDEIKRRLERAGLDMPIGRYAVLCGLLFLVGAMLINLSGMPAMISIFGGIIIGIGVPHILVGARMTARVQTFTKQFPEAIDLIVRGLKSGLPVNEVLVNVAQELKDPTGPEFRRVVDAVRLGSPLEDALWQMADRIGTPDVKFFVISISVQRETGGNLAETLSNLASILRQRQQMKLKVAALSSEAKASAWIVGSLPFIMYGFILMLNYEYASMLFTHPAASMAAIIALCWMSLGVFIMSRMITFEV